MSKVKPNNNSSMATQSEKGDAMRCPECKSTNIAKILYGMPDFNDDLQAKLESGEVSLGGCVVMG